MSEGGRGQGGRKGQVFLVSLSTMLPVAKLLLALGGIIWELTAHPVGLIGLSPGEDSGVTMAELELGVCSAGVRGQARRGEDEGGCAGICGGGGGGLVSASRSVPSSGKVRLGQGGMTGRGEESTGEEGRVVLRTLAVGQGECGVSGVEEREAGRARLRWPPLMKFRNLFFSNCSYLSWRAVIASSDMSCGAVEDRPTQSHTRQ